MTRGATCQPAGVERRHGPAAGRRRRTVARTTLRVASPWIATRRWMEVTRLWGAHETPPFSRGAPHSCIAAEGGRIGEGRYVTPRAGERWPPWSGAATRISSHLRYGQGPARRSWVTDRVRRATSPLVGVRVAVSLELGRAAAGALASAAAGASGRAGVAPARMAAAEVARPDASGQSGLAC